MSRNEWRLWFNEAIQELKNWPRRALIIWFACFVASLLLWFTAVAAKNTTADAWAGSASVSERINSAASQSASSENEPVAEVIEPTELVILEEQASPDEQGLKRISEIALTLHSRLQQGSVVAASYSSEAGRVAGLAVALRQEQLTNNDQSFWQPISEAIAKLERAVRLGEVSDGPTIGLITELRARYAELRIGRDAVVAEPSADDTTEAVAEQVEAETVDASEFTTDNSVTQSSVPLSLRLLPWLAACFPLGCLLFGVQAVRRKLHERHQKNPRAGYSHVVSKQQTLQMSSEPAQSNRHAAERRTQAAILQLLDEMEPLAEGDLTHVASVTEDLTGALADAFNQAVYELRRLVKQINRSSNQVRNAVSQSRERTFKMAKQGAVQAREVTRTTDSLNKMQSDVQSLSTTTQSVAEHAQDVAGRSQHAAHAVSKSCEALAVMRKQADTTERSMRRLVSSTQGIEARLADIQAAAKSTDLLALNSTIQAAAQGAVTDDSDAQNFSELATDVSSLAALLSSTTPRLLELSTTLLVTRQPH